MQHEVLDLLRRSSFYADYLSARFPRLPLMDVLQEGTERLQPLIGMTDSVPAEDDAEGA